MLIIGCVLLNRNTEALNIYGRYFEMITVYYEVFIIDIGYLSVMRFYETYPLFKQMVLPRESIIALMISYLLLIIHSKCVLTFCLFLLEG